MKVSLDAGDCRDVLRAMAGGGAQFDACLTDPPYHLASIVKRFGSATAAPAQFGRDGAFARASAGFMGKQWDGGDVATQPATWRAVFDVLKPGAYLLAFGGTRTWHRQTCAIEDAGFEIRDCLMWLYGTGQPKSHNQGDGRGTGLKPAWEPIALARKPHPGTIAANLAAYGTGALNINACRVTNLGRWPANVVHDGSDEVEAAFAVVGEKTSGNPCGIRKAPFTFGSTERGTPVTGYGDTGSVSRFFYCAKATKTDRSGSKHPTVKPLALLRWLVKLITPPGGIVLDPFAGSGTTLQAAVECGFGAAGIERDEEYINDIQRRMEMVIAA